MKVKVKVSGEELRKKLKVKDGYTPRKGIDYFDGKPGKNGEDADEARITQEVERRVSFKIPRPLDRVDFRDGLESFEGDERLSLTAISGLEEEILKLRKEMRAKSSGGSRRVFQPYVERFTSQTDGSAKTFYLKREPLRTDTIMVFGTDWPIVLDPTVDFTVSGKTLTLAAGIPAPSTGATVVISYYA